MDTCRNINRIARVPAGVISHPCRDALSALEARFTQATDGLNGDFCHAVKNTLWLCLAAVQTAVVFLGVECRLVCHALSWANFDY
jgi:hypothetical protein